MHTYSFLMKRGHWSAVRMGIRMFARVPDMTPARFDLMHVLYQHGRYPYRRNDIPITQVLLQRRLGVRRQTVWAMVMRLVELGLVEKTYEPNGRVRLNLTEEGLQRIRRAYGAAFTTHHPLPAEWRNEPVVPRYVYRIARDVAIEEAKAREPNLEERSLCLEAQPALVGSEVRRALNLTAWRTAGCYAKRRDHFAYLNQLEEMTFDLLAITDALGDTSSLIYPLNWQTDL